jgi:hypothetical protein
MSEASNTNKPEALPPREVVEEFERQLDEYEASLREALEKRFGDRKRKPAEPE